MIAGFIVFDSPQSYIINQTFFILPTETSMVFWVEQAAQSLRIWMIRLQYFKKKEFNYRLGISDLLPTSICVCDGKLLSEE